MNVTRIPRFVSLAALASVSLVTPVARAQQPAAQTPAPRVVRIVAEPASLVLTAGQSIPFTIKAYDSTGAVIADPRLRMSGPRGVMRMDVDKGQITGVTGVQAGKYEMVVMAVGDPAAQPVRITIPVTIQWPPIAQVEILPEPGRLYTGVTLAHRAARCPRRSVRAERRDGHLAQLQRRPSRRVDRFGNVTARRPGAVTITAQAEGASASIKHTVVANPVTSLSIDIDENSVRTGDVVHLKATAKRAGGSAVPDVPITWSYTYTPDDTIAAPGATGVIDRGLFAAEVPGRYTLLATAGPMSARKVIDVRPRNVRKRISVTGRGSINHVHTSDLWPWTGKDGRDYALVGTWGGDGWAYVFDITNLAAIVKTDSIKVDARVINDVTVSPDGRYGALSREGASNRVNGVVILDLATPAHPKIAATFDQQLTGGVHNMFATNDYLFAISNGDKYVIIDMKDISKPTYASEYDHPNSRVHDVWVHDGIAYSSEWGTGVVAVDVGNGK